MKQQRVPVHDRGDWKDGSHFEPGDCNFDGSNSGVSSDCDVSENNCESHFFVFFFFPQAVG